MNAREKEAGGLPVAMTVAGSDSGGGAGIQADLRTFAALQVFGTSAITAVTAQNTLEVRAVRMLSGEFVRTQMGAILDDFPVEFCKTGMLGNAEITFSVAEEIKTRRLKAVVDPVMVAKSGDRLLDDEALRTTVEHLLPRAFVLTPNLPEAEALCGFVVKTHKDQEQAALQLHHLGAKNVLVKGGHAEGDPADLFYDGKEFTWLFAERQNTRHTHGTGCTYSAAITANLARGQDVVDAVKKAHAYLQKAIEEAPGLGAGHGPVHHMHPHYPSAKVH
jgi:hydroxymethylpyrimidine/phosphomethylpyrimidine kinase